MRRIAGPANCLEDENDQNFIHDSRVKHKKLELSAQISWINLRKSLGINELEIDFPKELIPFTIGDVLKGQADLRVPRMVALVLSVIHTASGIWTLTLTDNSKAAIEAFVTPKVVEFYPELLIPGTSFLAEKVSIFVSSPTCQRVLNLHERCITAIYPSQNSPFQSQINIGEENYFQEEEDDD